jgi:hypothetical protein
MIKTGGVDAGSIVALVSRPGAMRTAVAHFEWHQKARPFLEGRGMTGGSAISGRRVDRSPKWADEGPIAAPRADL